MTKNLRPTSNNSVLTSLRAHRLTGLLWCLVAVLSVSLYVAAPGYAGAEPAPQLELSTVTAVVEPVPETATPDTEPTYTPVPLEGNTPAIPSPEPPATEVTATSTPAAVDTAEATATVEIPTATPIPEDTATSTATSTDTASPTGTATETATLTSTPSDTPTSTATSTATITPTATPTWWPPGPECKPQPGKILARLAVPYIHQVLDIGGADGNWACGPTSVAMVLAYYGKLAPWQDYISQQPASSAVSVTPPTATSTLTAAPAAMPESSRNKPTATATQPSGRDYAPYVTNEYSNESATYSSTALDPQGQPVAGLYGAICPTGSADWSRMIGVLQQHGLTSRYIGASWDGVVQALKRGNPVILGNDLTPAGHILVAIGYTDNGHLLVNDPYGNRFIEGYGGTNGAGVLYPWDCSRVRTALEVIGTYPPPPKPSPTATETPTATPTVEATATATSSATASLATASPTRTTLPAKARTVASPGAARPSATPARQVKIPVVGNVLVGKNEDNRPGSSVAQPAQKSTLDATMISWGLLSTLGLAAALLGMFGFKRLRNQNPPGATGQDMDVSKIREDKLDAGT